jgi:hypothetical protein
VRNGFGQISHDKVYPPPAGQRRDSSPDLACQLADRNAPPAADGNHHMIRSHPDPGHLPPRQVGHHATPQTRTQIIDSRAVASRRRDSVEIDTVDHRRPHSVSPGRGEPGHDTREGASSWSSLPGM